MQNYGRPVITVDFLTFLPFPDSQLSSLQDDGTEIAHVQDLFDSENLSVYDS